MLFISLALAKPEPCEPPFVRATVPSNGATGVPVDVRVAAIYGLEGCGTGGVDTLRLTRVADGVTIAEENATIDHDGELAALALPSALDPDTDYLLEALGYATPSVAFTTGSGTVVGLEGAPDLRTATVDFQPQTRYAERGITVEWTVDPVADPDGLSILAFTDGATTRAPFAVRAGEETQSGSLFWAGERPTEVCPELRQVDGRGGETPVTGGECLPVGCAAADAPMTGLGLAFGLWALAGRRPRSGARENPPPKRSAACRVQACSLSWPWPSGGASWAGDTDDSFGESGVAGLGDVTGDASPTSGSARSTSPT